MAGEAVFWGASRRARACAGCGETRPLRCAYTGAAGRCVAWRYRHRHMSCRAPHGSGGICVIVRLRRADRHQQAVHVLHARRRGVDHEARHLRGMRRQRTVSCRGSPQCRKRARAERRCSRARARVRTTDTRLRNPVLAHAVVLQAAVVFAALARKHQLHRRRLGRAGRGGSHLRRRRHARGARS